MGKARSRNATLKVADVWNTNLLYFPFGIYNLTFTFHHKSLSLSMGRERQGAETQPLKLQVCGILMRIV